MWIVRLALDRPYTFIVLAILLAILGPYAVLGMGTDIFPAITIPVVGVIWTYNGLPPQEMGGRITSVFERACLVAVNDVDHIESQSLTGVAVVKIFFHEGANVDLSMSQVTAVAQTMLRQLPPGITPPFVLAYNASSVPIIQLALSSRTIPDQGLYDLANNFVRTQLAGVPGASIPFPYGGKTRQIQVDLDQPKMQARGVSAQDVVAAVNAQNLIIPSGTEKVGEFEYNVRLNGSAVDAAEVNDFPVRASDGTITYIRDIGHARDGFAPQTNVVRVDGRNATLMTVQKTGNASTLDIISDLKARLPSIRAASPKALTIAPIGDQSLFVKAAISGVVREGVIAAALTGLMILLFLGSWRSTVIIVISIPLSVICAILGLYALGQTISIMTLGGLALAVGILVDDATVAIENINAHLEEGEEVEDAILNGAQEIAVPALVATLCICIVFMPMFFLSGVARYLFVPLAEAISFAMLASYFLSRTLVPTLAKYWLRKHEKREDRAPSRNPLTRAQERFEHGFEAVRERYRQVLEGVLARRGRVLLAVVLGVGVSLSLFPWLGSDFFPSVDSGQIKLHLRAHAGLRVEETARLCDEVERAVHRVIPGGEVENIVDNIGLPVSGINLTYSTSAPTTAADADVMITLKPDHRPTADYIRRLRVELPRAFPGVTFAFLPADIVTQILNFGIPSPIDVQVSGFDLPGNFAFAQKLLKRVSHVPGIADAHLQQAEDYPEFDVRVDRSRVQEIGLTQRDIANDMLASLSGSFQTSPSFWLSPKNGVSYPLVVQTPQYQLNSLDRLRNIPVVTADGRQRQILGAFSTIRRNVGPSMETHYNVAPAIDIYATTQDRDLGAVAADVRRIVDEMRDELPRGAHIAVRGQVQTMGTAFHALFAGLAFATLLVLLLIVVNFQSWTDALIIISALPAALAGIVWMLFLTRTPVSVPALTGAIMSIGVATANSILVVSFARDYMAEAKVGAAEAAAEAGFRRFRPVLMTALAMMIGMLPMALGLGEGGEQNAPLGRAVIGGLLFATTATLMFVPLVFSLVHGRREGAAHSAPAGGRS
ncbi:cation/multidrug efflux pump [Neoasaia chiangmaiensis NBRC 101099]|uniref:RND transporter n=1 Tax=Neoasaia chiangmaiensis TaxID=320497 RepID=A0A1U9KQ67_9PROT|nr:efflux RND transporter permease subunit [Neoasaia chiangmaiensis]AQS87935.1 RND transporter [Neoasaia chiangmaiensis]GBR39025.1 cation/multidrug efflux pump [Neoasaia chiangmaiensis NBRC 101099]GEN15589.1 RND transporter [Neoasaia chiangmaiensis]